MSLPEKKKEVTTVEAAMLLGVSSSRIRQFILEGRLKAEKKGRDLWIKLKDVERFKRDRELENG